MSTFAAYDIASRALEAFQAALDVTGNNITNVNTPGYTRQRANFTENPALNAYGLQPYELGTGVNVGTVTQIQDLLLNQSLANSQSGLGQYSALAGTLQSVQQVFPEPSANGISSALSAFFNAWSALASNPGDSAKQLTVQQAASALASKLSSSYSQLQEQAQTTQQSVTSTFDEIDKLSAAIAKLNKEIAPESAAGGSPNALLDQRNQDIQQLSGLIDVTTTYNKDGTVNVYSNQLNLVDQGGAIPIPRGYSPASLSLFDASASTPIQSGQLTGLLQGLNKIQSYESQLNQLADNLESEVNGLYKAGKNSQGKTGQLFFTNSGTGAAGISLNAALESNPALIATGVSGKEGDGAIALAISQLAGANVKGLGAQSFGQFYQGLIGQIGSDAQSSANAQGTATALVQQVQNQQQSVSGVNLDEEMSTMLQYQQSYQAAAKALSIFDQTTNDLLGMVQ